jgi:flagellar basal-body rod protein FlgB
MNGLGIRAGGGLFGSESIPILESAIQFASQRHIVLLNNVANWNTPGFRAKDLPEGEFQRALSEAIGRRATGSSPLEIPTGRFVRRTSTGELRVEPIEVDTGAMRHDGNTVVIDQEQAKLLKNAMTVQIFNRLLIRKFRTLRTAISGRLG